MIRLEQTCISFADIFNIPWKEAVTACMPRYEEEGREIPKHDLWTDEKVEKVFSEHCPKGLVSGVESILDKGYTIFIRDNGLNVRQFWIDKVDEQQKSILKETEVIFGRALQMEGVLKIGIDLFKKTLEAGEPYEYEEWFGAKKRYYNYVTGQPSTASRLDFLLVQSGGMMRLSKNTANYELTFQDSDEKNSLTIAFKKFTIC